MIHWLEGIPLVWAKVIGMLFFVSVIVWAVLRPRAYIFRGAPDKKVWRDLRIWAVVVLVVQIILYLKF